MTNFQRAMLLRLRHFTSNARDHSAIKTHDDAWQAACIDLGIVDILAVSRERFREALQLATAILQYEQSRSNIQREGSE
jgi:hypothetical protein